MAQAESRYYILYYDILLYYYVFYSKLLPVIEKTEWLYKGSTDIQWYQFSIAEYYLTISFWIQFKFSCYCNVLIRWKVTNGDCFFISLDSSSRAIATFFFCTQRGFLFVPNYFPSPQEVWRKHWRLSGMYPFLFLSFVLSLFLSVWLSCLSISLPHFSSVLCELPNTLRKSTFLSEFR